MQLDFSSPATTPRRNLRYINSRRNARNEVGMPVRAIDFNTTSGAANSSQPSATPVRGHARAKMTPVRATPRRRLSSINSSDENAVLMFSDHVCVRSKPHNPNDVASGDYSKDRPSYQIVNPVPRRNNAFPFKVPENDTSGLSTPPNVGPRRRLDFSCASAPHGNRNLNEILSAAPGGPIESRAPDRISEESAEDLIAQTPSRDDNDKWLKKFGFDTDLLAQVAREYGPQIAQCSLDFTDDNDGNRHSSSDKHSKAGLNATEFVNGTNHKMVANPACYGRAAEVHFSDTFGAAGKQTSASVVRTETNTERTQCSPAQTPGGRKRDLKAKAALFPTQIPRRPVLSTLNLKVHSKAPSEAVQTNMHGDATTPCSNRRVRTGDISTMRPPLSAVRSRSQVTFKDVHESDDTLEHNLRRTPGESNSERIDAVEDKPIEEQNANGTYNFDDEGAHLNMQTTAAESLLHRFTLSEPTLSSGPKDTTEGMTKCLTGTSFEGGVTGMTGDSDNVEGLHDSGCRKGRQRVTRRVSVRELRGLQKHWVNEAERHPEIENVNKANVPSRGVGRETEGRGSMTCLTPMRASQKHRKALGTAMVVTPVRRSLRISQKHDSGSLVQHQTSDQKSGADLNAAKMQKQPHLRKARGTSADAGKEVKLLRKNTFASSQPVLR